VTLRFGDGELPPPNPVEDHAKALTLGRVDRLHEADPSFKVRAKAGMPVSVLALWTHANAVGECRLEAVEVGSPDIHVFIGNQTGEIVAVRLGA
jgi:hypothetical protein